jgi:hypothetical protein
MIPATDHAMFKRLPSQPMIEGPDLLRIVARVHKISSMDQNIALGKLLNSIVETMSVRDHNKTHELTP